MIKVLEKAAREAGKITLKHFQKQLDIQTKSNPRDLVTQVDLESQQEIQKIILEELKKKGISSNEIGFIGEEGLTSNTGAEHLFVIDPLDGTSNYARGNDAFCISIAYFYQKELEIGLIYIPVKDDLYFAQKGQRAFKISSGIKNQLVIKSPERADLRLAFNTSSSEEVTKKVLKKVSKFKPLVKKIDETPSCILTILSVVDNHYNVSLNGRCRLWDISAVKLITEEAGGIMVNWEGEEINLNLEDTGRPYEIMVTTKDLLREYLNV